MPELPEVQIVVNTLQSQLPGRRILLTELHRPDILRPRGLNLEFLLKDKRLQSISRRAKRVIFHLHNGHRFYIHLGMTGQITLHSPSEPLLRHTHLILHLSQALQLRFRDPRRFGGIFWLGNRPDTTPLGPEPLTLPARQLAQRLAATRRPIKSALLDQSLIAGLGNIYVDESLFTAGIHPLKITSTLSPPQIARLNRAIKSTLRRAIHLGGSSIRDYRDANGQPGSFQHHHRVYHRNRQPCIRCGHKIEKITLAGRSTHFCPVCQPR